MAAREGMSRVSAVLGLALLVVLGAACGRGERSGAGRDSSATASRTAEPPLCDPSLPAIESGIFNGMGGSDSSDATASGTIARRVEGDCARYTLALTGPGGTPAARVGVARGMVLRSLGVVRVLLPGGVNEVAEPDTAFGHGPVRAAYVVRGRGGRMFLDLHLDGPSLARVTTRDEPGRILIDLGPGGGAVPDAAPSAANIVVLEPRAGSLKYPFTIQGYGRTFEANVVAELRVDGKVVHSTHVTAADYSVTWGEFKLGFGNGPTGPVELFVGEYSAADGSPRGVTIPLVLR